jgi:hypothetical protein
MKLKTLIILSMSLLMQITANASEGTGFRNWEWIQYDWRLQYKTACNSEDLCMTSQCHDQTHPSLEYLNKVYHSDTLKNCDELSRCSYSDLKEYALSHMNPDEFPKICPDSI